MRTLIGTLSILLAASASAQTTVQTYQRHDSAATAARRAGDWAGYSTHIPMMDSILNGHPNVKIVRARIGAHLGDTATAYANLRDFVKAGLRRRIEADTDLVALRGTPEWNSLISGLAANGGVIGNFTPAFTMPDSDFVAEDITYDPNGKRWLVSGIRRSVIISVDQNGRQSMYARGTDKGWGILALAADPGRNTLWVTAEAIPLALEFDTTLAGKAAVFRHDLKSGKLLQRYEMPSSEKHGAGDIAVAENGDLFIADATTGELYVITNGGALQLLTPKGEFMSPQGPAIAPDGKHFYIADYARGLARVDRASGKVEWLRIPRDVALNGIDGLTTADAKTLIGVQNGTNPNRLIRISLDDSGLRVTRVESVAQNEASIKEPTHGVFVGRDYYFIGNGGFGAFGDDGKLKAGERNIAPVIMKLGGLR